MENQKSGKSRRRRTSKRKKRIIERILEKRKRKGFTEFLIKWMGKDESKNSWEPEETLNPSMELLKNFKNQSKKWFCPDQDQKTQKIR